MRNWLRCTTRLVTWSITAATLLATNAAAQVSVASPDGRNQVTVEIQAGPGGSLSGINPHDIATIEVVKDPAGEAMYGVRGANGVIIIKTKRPDQ